MTDPTWPELLQIARDGLASREPFDAAAADTMARAIVAMDAELRATMQPHLLRATRLYTDELGALRKRVAELEPEAARIPDLKAAIGYEIERRDAAYSRIAELEAGVTLLDAKQGGQLRRALKTVGREIQEMFRRHLDEFRQQNHRPIVSVLEHLPKEELAELAESLVHLTSTRRRVAMEAETVGGPIDVAVISKGDGFIWMKRKHYFRPELNPQFFARLQEEGKP